MIQLRRRHSAAVVAHFDYSEPLVVGPARDAQLALSGNVRQRVGCVGQEVYENLAEPTRIRTHGRSTVIVLDESTFFLDLLAEHGNGRSKHRDDIDRLVRSIFLSGKDLEVVHDAADSVRTVTAIAHEIDQFFQLIGELRCGIWRERRGTRRRCPQLFYYLCGLVYQDLGVGQHIGERIVDFVRQSRGEQARCDHSVGENCFGIGVPLISDVPGDRQDRRTTLEVDRQSRGVDNSPRRSPRAQS